MTEATELGGGRGLLPRSVGVGDCTSMPARERISKPAIEACATVGRPVRADSALARRIPKSRALASPTCG